MDSTGGGCQADEAAAHEADFGAVWNHAEHGAEEHGWVPIPAARRGRRAVYQRTIIMRASTVAVNSVVTMPTVMVTAKPRTGPEPNTKSITWARKAVALLSIMVL